MKRTLHERATLDTPTSNREILQMEARLKAKLTEARVAFLSGRWDDANKLMKQFQNGSLRMAQTVRRYGRIRDLYTNGRRKKN